MNDLQPHTSNLPTCEDRDDSPQNPRDIAAEFYRDSGALFAITAEVADAIGKGIAVFAKELSNEEVPTTVRLKILKELRANQAFASDMMAQIAELPIEVDTEMDDLTPEEAEAMYVD